MASIKNVIIIGANGTIGASIFSAIVTSNLFNVSVLTRPSSTTSYDPTIRVFVSDYSPSSLAEAFKGQDAVVSALGAAGIGEQIKIIDAAVKAGVKRFLPSEYSANSQNKKVTDLIPVFKTKADVIEHLRMQEAVGLSWTAVESGLALDSGPGFSLVGFDLARQTAQILDGGNRPFSSTNTSQIGNAIVAVLSNPEVTANQFLYIESFTVTQNEILAELEKATRKKWAVSAGTAELVQEEGNDLFAKGDMAGLYKLLTVMVLGEGFEADFRKYGLANGKLGLPKQTVADTVAAVVAGIPV